MSTGGSVTPAYNVPDILQNAGFEWTEGDALTADTTLVQGSYRLQPVDPSGGTFTLTLPEDPYEGMLFGIKNVTSSATNITVDGNGENIEGAGSYLFGGPYRTRWLQYGATQWQIVGGAN